jgi:hypothetical protein
MEQLLKLTETGSLPELGPGPRPGALSLSQLDGSLGPLLEKARLPSQAEELIRALIYLWHDHLDEAHTISQGIETSDGSLVHGIMHRREPDYSNARYWLHRVGEHPSFVELAERARPLLASAPDLQKKLLGSGNWNAIAFIDACEKAARDRTHDELLRQIQAAELRLLLEYYSSDSE